jgi:hypothetical protein
MLSHARRGFNDTGVRQRGRNGAMSPGVRRRTRRPTSEHSSWRYPSFILISLNKQAVFFVRHGTNLDENR